jgi:UDP-N-acetylglucosamine transferase subunit ALG13
MAADLPQPIVVQRGSTAFKSPRCEVVDFLDMTRFAEAIATATLVITHAGAGSIIHARQAGKVPVVMPRRQKAGEIIDDHQVELAEALAMAGLIYLANDLAELRKAVESAMTARSAEIPLPVPPMLGLIDARLRELGGRPA